MTFRVPLAYNRGNKLRPRKSLEPFPKYHVASPKLISVVKLLRSQKISNYLEKPSKYPLFLF